MDKIITPAVAKSFLKMKIELKMVIAIANITLPSVGLMETIACILIVHGTTIIILVLEMVLATHHLTSPSVATMGETAFK